MTTPTARAMATALRTYHRPLKDGDTLLESWEQVVDRVISHQRWLWTRALGRSLNEIQEDELEELRSLIQGRYVAPAGRTLWLGGTELSRTRESSMFNCSYTHVETVYDVVDVLWLLLQGCGVGFRPITGTLNGFRRPLQEIKVIRSNRTEKGGVQQNLESFDPKHVHGQSRSAILQLHGPKQLVSWWRANFLQKPWCLISRRSGLPARA